MNYTLWNEQQIEVFKKYKNKCTLCNFPAVTLHEEPPKSLNPKWKEQPETWYPLCNDCHTKVHNMPRDLAKSLLESKSPDAV